MKSRLRLRRFRRLCMIALPLALLMAFLLPLTASAHAILLRSDPAQDAELSVAPQQVRMWFSEDLNPAFSTAVVVNQRNQRVDKADAHVTSTDPREMDVSLSPNLPPAVYVVVWRTDSADDGHILRGSFLFTIKRADGSVPSLNGNTIPGQNELDGGNLTGLYTGQLDAPTFFNFVMITLVELGTIFWVGAQFWLIFVLQLASKGDATQDAIHQQIQARFERRWSLPILLALVVANVGILVGQALIVTGGQWLQAFSPQLLLTLVSSGRFGTYWTVREVVLALAILLALFMLLVKKRPSIINGVLPSLNLLLGSMLCIAIALSSHAAAVNANILVEAVLIDWFHLIAASLWVGGMLYIATIYLPILRKKSIAERVQSLVTLLARFSPLAITGVVLMSITGPFSATIHLNSWEQLFSTAYGRALSVKIVLVGVLLITSGIHVLFLRPRLAKEYKKYIYAHQGVTFNQAQQIKLREGRMAKRVDRLTSILRWEPLAGVAIVACVGLMNVFAGTLTPIAAPQQQQPATNAASAYNTIVQTTDHAFTVKLNINPNRFGTNLFTVTVIDNSTGKPTTNVGVSVYTQMLDMDMGTDNVNLLPDGKGHFSAPGDLAMSGNWAIRVQIRAPDHALHEA
ncbi:MAG: copper resistance protein CopC, partial [Ktedonobacteraceae bacterium]